MTNLKSMFFVLGVGIMLFILLRIKNYFVLKNYAGEIAFLPKSAMVLVKYSWALAIIAFVIGVTLVYSGIIFE